MIITTRMWQSATLLAFSGSSLASQGSATSAICCGSLAAAGLGDRLLYPDSDLYREREASYFSLGEELHPWCILQPQSASEVSTAVQVLVGTVDCRFAVRSGGHHQAAGCNNIHDGVTVDLGQMNAVAYHAENSTTSMQPGATWGEVYKTLDPLNLTVAGGRDTSVGVGGLFLGGGNSFFSAERGMACDGVVRFEIVLGNGKIIIADNGTNNDLFLALKGGGNNFGIVTRFDVDTFQTGQLWGGTVYYPLDAQDTLIEAFVKFGDNVDDNPASSTILFWTYQPSVNATLIGTSMVNVEGVVMDPAHNEFWAVQNTSSTMRTTNITDLVEELEFPGKVYDCVEYTVAFQNDARVISKLVELHDEVLVNMKAASDTGDFISVAMFQPLALSYAARGLERGGNVLGLNKFTGTHVLCLIWLQVKGAEQSSIADKLVSGWWKAVDDYANSIGKGSQFLYLNYADETQDPLSGYGHDNLEKIAHAAKKYDPTGVFQTRVSGGFKISKVYAGYKSLELNRDEL